MADAHKRRFDAVCVWKFDRFARSLSHLLRALETFKALGIEFISFSELPTTEPLWKYVESLNPFTCDAALAVLAQLREPSTGDRSKYPMLEPVLITRDAILGYKGIRRRGRERQLLLARIHDEMELLRGLQFDVESYSAFDASTRRWEKASWQGDRLFDIVRVEVTQHGLCGGRQHIEVAWRVRAGQWAYWWLNPQSRVYLGKLARTLLELDHRNNRGPEVVAKKIGTRLVFLYHALRRPKTPLKLTIGNLLEDVGELVKPDVRDQNWAARTRKNFDDAVIVLGPGDTFTQGIGILHDVQWPRG
jgi:hypothetical protein